MMNRVLAEDSKIVNILPPVDITGGKFSDVFSMRKHAHATIIIQVGVSAAAWTKIIVNACDDNSPTNRTAIPFTLYSCTTATGDILTGPTSVAAAGADPSANDNIFYVIEIDAEELPENRSWIELSLTNGSNSVIASAIAILTGSRYAVQGADTVLS